jgi:hypothetical protein
MQRGMREFAKEKHPADEPGVGEIQADSDDDA